jgi:hypothetical protein
MPTAIVVPFPDDFRKPEALADWLELTALHAADHDSSIGDVERELNRLNYGGRESLLGNILTELDRRVRATGDVAYPFERGATSIQLKGDASRYPAYLFCLALSYYKWKIRKGVPENPWLLFEELAFYSAKNYLGQAILFGTSSRKGSKAKDKFKTSIDNLVKALGEGQSFTSKRTFSSKDSKLDLVAWKGFEDRRASQIIIFGQCKAGEDWRAGLTELDPESFWDKWMTGGKGKVSKPLRSVFIPHRVFDDEEWDLRARDARLLFDRCRVVAHAHKDTAEGPFADRLLNCCRAEWSLPV